MSFEESDLSDSIYEQPGHSEDYGSEENKEVQEEDQEEEKKYNSGE